MSTDQSAALVDGVASFSLPLDDRGLLYGDGLFETIRFDDGQAALWRWHMLRLRHGCQRLMLALPAEQLMLRECRQLAGTGPAVVRLVLTRGSATAPGYASTGREIGRRLVMRLAVPQARGLIRLGLCQQPMAAGGVTEGLKHLCRLEQVLLAREISEHGWDEGLLFDRKGWLCEALQSNVCVQMAAGSQWITPPVGAGVAGTARAALLEFGLVVEQPISRKQLERAAEVVLCNAVRWVEPVSQLEPDRNLSVQAGSRLAEDFRRHLLTGCAQDSETLTATSPVGPASAKASMP